MTATPIARPSAARGAHAPSRATLALVLVLAGRALLNASYCAWLWRQSPGWSAFFHSAANYALLDGGLALLSAALLAHNALHETQRGLTAAMIGNDPLEMACGVLIILFPGLPEFPITAVELFAVVGTYAALLAFIAIAARFREWRHDAATGRAASLTLHEELDPIVAAGLATLVLATFALVAGPPTNAVGLRTLGMRWTGVLSISLLLAALGVARELASGRVAERARLIS